MKNRIFGITVLLAVIVLGLAFISCPADAEDCELTFINQTSVKISIVTDGSPISFDLAKAKSAVDDTQRKTVTKKASEIEITSLSFEGISADDWDRYLRIEINATPNQKVKNKLKLGSGTVVFVAADKDADGTIWGNNMNPAATFSKISVITLDE